MTYVRDMIAAMLNEHEGSYFTVGSEGEIDYRGNNVNKIMDAITDVDEADIRFYNVDGDDMGWGYIVNEYGEEPDLADCSGIIGMWDSHQLIYG